MSESRLQQLLHMLESSPGDAFLLFAIAKEYENLGEADKTLAFYQKLEADNPGYVGTYYHLGKYYEQQGMPKKAFHTYRKGMEIARGAGDEHGYHELAAAKAYLGDEEDFE